MGGGLPDNCFHFFQAEDGIRDYKVTGVQTCALPIWDQPAGRSPYLSRAYGHHQRSVQYRSEERREGKSVDLGGRRIIKKKKQHHVRGAIGASPFYLFHAGGGRGVSGD